MLSGAKAVVTGSSRGIGLALAQRLSELGATVTMVARDAKQLESNVPSLATPANQKHSFISYDLVKLVHGDQDGEAKFTELFADSTILVNCAGVANNNLLHKLTPEKIAATINTNLLSPILLSRLAVRPMLKSSRSSKTKPSILNISSLLSSTGVSIAGTAPYAASKAGLLGFTEALACELNGKVRVNAVLPALVPETAMGKGGSPTLPAVALEDVIDICERVLTDEALNGKFAAADGSGFRTIN